jgi:putative protease
MELKPFYPEILAPVGGKEQLYAAVKSGADAVYFGAADFNARRNAENFTPEGFAAAVRYCRTRGVKCYITLNTLLTDRELPAFAETLRMVAQSGANAVIVQDLAAAAAVKQYAPALALHASTQMAVHNVSGAKLLESSGFRRVVLARELSLKEIAAVAGAVNIETEVFVHGAHCMGFSGLCYTSCAFGSRSANRGLCAQPCRLDFRNDRRDHCLSLKDMSLVEHLEELKNAGVCSFKIEGRMKRPEYVAAAVNACRVKLSGGQPDTGTLRSVFSRGGFTDGYLTSRVNGEMFGYRTKEDVTAAAGVLKSLQRLYDKEYPRVELNMALTVQAGLPLRLSVSDGANTAAVEGPPPEAALTVPLTAEKAGTSLTKLGDTPYFCKEIDADIGAGLAVPASALNALRRAAVEKLNELRGAAPEVTDKTKEILAEIGALPFAPAPENKALRLRFQTAVQAFSCPECETVILPLQEVASHPETLTRFGEKLAAEVPVLLFPADEKKALETLLSLKEKGLKAGVAENIGAVKLLSDAGLEVRCGAHMNITNRLALSELEALGCRDTTLSFELHLNDMKALRCRGKTGYIAYGRLPLMRFRACPQRDEKGCGDCRGRAGITDRKNERFPLLCDGRRYSTMFNSVPLCAVGFPQPQTDFYTLYFTVETPEQCREITARILKGEKPEGRITAGQYNKRLL